MIGEKFNRLTIINSAVIKPKKGACWECRCECGNVLTVAYYRLKTGHTKSCGCLVTQPDLKVRIVNGIGVYDPTRTSRHAAPHLSKLYILWRGILYRSTERFQLLRPSYRTTSVSQEFRHFSDFVEWAMKQIGWGKKYDLDKDLLVKGNREYSADKCVFLPRELNILLTNRARGRGPYPVGVTVVPTTGRFASQLSVDGKIRRLGTFATAEEAFATYKAGKEAHMRELAEKYRAQIDPRAYEALVARQIDITD